MHVNHTSHDAVVWGAGKLGAGAVFGMDANTGRLLPQTVAAHADGGSGARSSSQDCASVGGGSDLLETPALGSAPSQGWRPPGPSRMRATASQPLLDGGDPDAQAGRLVICMPPTSSAS